MSIIVFDICGTLFRSNTTFDFLDYLLKDNNKYKIWRSIYKSILWKILNKILRKIFNLDLTRILSLKFLKHYSRNILSEKAHEFVKEFLIPLSNISITNILTDYLQRDVEHVYLASATIDIVGEAVAKYFGCKNYYTSKLEYDKDNCCTGRICLDLLGNKLSVINDNTTIGAVFTDDLSDERLLAIAQEKNIVVYSRYRKSWKQLVTRNNWDVNLWEI